MQIDQDQFDKILSYIDAGKSAGARLMAGAFHFSLAPFDQAVSTSNLHQYACICPCLLNPQHSLTVYQRDRINFQYPPLSTAIMQINNH